MYTAVVTQADLPFPRVQIDDFSMVSFMPLDATDEDSVGSILSHIDNAVQYGEDEEPKEPKDLVDGDGDMAE